MPTFSLSIDHTPWIPARRERLARMLLDLLPLSNRIPYLLHDTDYRGKPWADVKHEWALAKWRWHLQQDVTHCILLSDDLAIMPHFWEVVGSMVEACPASPIGLMSNHPDGPKLFDAGHSWYACSAWLVGPGIIFPRDLLARFVAWYEDWYFKLPTGHDLYGYREWFHDDSSMNEWITRELEGCSVHPLPSPIEHQLGIGRSHDAAPFPEHAAEWISWRRIWHENPGRALFSELPKDTIAAMRTKGWWKQREAPVLKLPGVE
jgi:hypothetical protein